MYCKRQVWRHIKYFIGSVYIHTVVGIHLNWWHLAFLLLPYFFINCALLIKLCIHLLWKTGSVCVLIAAAEGPVIALDSSNRWGFRHCNRIKGNVKCDRLTESHDGNSTEALSWCQTAQSAAAAAFSADIRARREPRREPSYGQCRNREDGWGEPPPGQRQPPHIHNALNAHHSDYMVVQTPQV